MLARSALTMLANRALETPLPHLSTDWCLVDPPGCIWSLFDYHDGNQGSDFDGKVFQPFLNKTRPRPWLLGGCLFLNPPPTWGREKKAQKWPYWTKNCLACSHPLSWWLFLAMQAPRCSTPLRHQSTQASLSHSLLPAIRVSIFKGNFYTLG